MKSGIRRFVSKAMMAAPLLAILVVQACDSPVAPKFPEPIEEPDTIRNDDEGVTRRGRIGVMTAADDSIRRLILVPCPEVSPCR